MKSKRFILIQHYTSLNEEYNISKFSFSKTSTDPDLLVQDSNDVPLINRARGLDLGYIFSGPGSTLGIRRNGVIKQWKFYSSEEGYTTFTVFRPYEGSDSKG